MNPPEMIMFDYGHTLLWEPDWDSVRGNRALMEYITKNPQGCTLEDMEGELNAVMEEAAQIRKAFNYDIPCRTCNRLAYERLGLEFSLSPLEMESVFWWAATPGAVAPNAAAMLAHLNARGIRTAIISNNVWSGEALKERFDRLLPGNTFEFIVSSCDYMIRKPDRRIFEIALTKARLTADKVWYCGDNKKSDVYGAHGAGIFPVLYEGSFPDRGAEYYEKYKDVKIDMPHLHLHDWAELIAILG